MARRLQLVLILLVIYNINLRQVSSLDTLATRFVPISLLRDGDLVLDEFVPDYIRHAKPDDDFSNFTLVRGHYYDSHPPIGPILASPVYALPVWLGIPASPELTANAFSKLAASIMAAFSALAIFEVVRRLLARSGRREPDRVAFAAALAYGICTSVWSTAGLALWSHTPTILCYALSIWLIATGRVTWAGLAAVAAAMSRPATAPAAGVLMLLVAHRAHRLGSREEWMAAFRCFALAAVAAISAGIYNVWLLGNVLGGARGRTEIWMRELHASSMFSGSLPVGLAGLTVSPSYGLLIFSPIVAVAVVGAVRAWREKPPVAEPVLIVRYVSLAALVVLLTYSKFIAWWGGHGYGPRYLTDAMPFVGVLLGWGFAAVPGMRRPARAAIAVLVGYSAAVQAIGAFCWPSPWTLDKNPPPHLRLWDWRNNQIRSSFESGPKIDPAARKLFSFVFDRDND